MEFVFCDFLGNYRPQRWSLRDIFSKKVAVDGTSRLGDAILQLFGAWCVKPDVLSSGLSFGNLFVARKLTELRPWAFSPNKKNTVLHLLSLVLFLMRNPRLSHKTSKALGNNKAACGTTGGASFGRAFLIQRTRR